MSIEAMITASKDALDLRRSRSDSSRSGRYLSIARATAGLVLFAGLLAAAPAAAEDAPKIGVAPSQIKFGTVEVAKTKSSKIRNHGKADLEVAAITPCAGTSGEFSWTQATPFTLAPKKSLTLDVTYAPADTGDDQGCLEITSNDPKRPTVKVNLFGRAEDDSPPADGPDIDLMPDSLNFGDVPVGGSSTLKVKVKNKGTSSLEGVMVGRCFETSPEFSWDPTDMFSVPADENVVVRVTYMPTDEGSDEGCLEIVSNDPDENPAVLDVSGNGVVGGAGVDLDITSFKVKKRFEAGASDEIFVELWVRNETGINEPRLAVVVGMQAGIVVYEESLMVADKGGNRGSKKYTFPSFVPTGAGEILWMAMIQDDDPDADEAYAVTEVVSPPAPSVGVDLDAVKLKATRKVSLARNRPIRLRVWFENPGSLDGIRTATLIGFQGGVEIYNESVDVSDLPGDDAATRYAFPSYVPVLPGDIVWTVTVSDDDPDVDQTSAVTRVNQ